MATYIHNTDDNQVYCLECIVDGVDILGDVIGGSLTPDRSDDQGWLMGTDEMEWWRRWAEREERICAAYAEADEDTRAEYERAIIGNGHDLELLQDVQERVLGIDR